MEGLPGAYALLDMFPRPAFCVKDGSIIKTNAAAASQLMETGTPVSPLLSDCGEEYAAFEGGCLLLYLNLGGRSLPYSVRRIGGTDIFCQEQEDTEEDLRAMALASRELRQSLAGVMSTTDRLFPNPELISDPQTREQISRINRGLFQLLRIVGNMSDAGAGTGDTSRQEVRNIPALLEEIFTKAAALIAHTGIRLQYSGCPEAVYSLCDPQRLERAVLNILSNAVKFTPGDGTIDVSLTRRGSRLYLRITDSGPGIPQELLGSLFSRHQRSPGLEDSRFGIGLGFAMIRAAAAVHGGTVLVDQPAGRGTRVTLSLAIRSGGSQVCSPGLRVDYTGERDHCLVELSDVLPAHLYAPELI